MLDIMKKVSGFFIFVGSLFAYFLLISSLFSCTVESSNDVFELSAGIPYIEEEEEEKYDLSTVTLDVIPNSESSEPRCEDIDFLFVIDNSGSMSDDQQNLIANFPTFVEGIEHWIPSLKSAHIGIVTTDSFYWNESGCQKLGALVTRTGGYNAPADLCGINDPESPDEYADGNRFMTNNDDLVEAFTCAANVGTNGSGSEQQLGAMVQALEVYYNSPGQCNAGFLREYALLVVVILTDEDDQSGDIPENWRDHLVWLKQGKMEDIVILSIINLNDSWSNAENLEAFTLLFGSNGFVGDIAAISYEGFFKDAISVIFGACYGDVPKEP